MIIAIDGPAGSGKSSTARAVAASLGITYLDTGAMYRVITLKSLREGIAASDDAALEKLCGSTSISFRGDVPDTRVLMDGEDVSDAIRSDDVTKNVSDYCVPAVVRSAMVRQQQKFAEGHSVVLDGRDIGTVVFPDADLKFYMTASVDERARRRRNDFAKLGVTKTIEELIEEITLRDKKDSTRENSPLRKAADAVEMDTTLMSLEEQVRFIVDRALARRSSDLSTNLT